MFNHFYHDINAAQIFRKAARDGNMDYVTAALNDGIDVNVARANTGTTALMLAANNAHLETVRLLIEKGANVNRARTNDGITALILAAENGYLETVRLLLEKGANVNHARTDDGTTALMLAAERGQLQTVRLLIEKGADVTKTDFYGHTAADDAFKNGHSEISDLLSEKHRELAAVKQSKKEAIKKSDRHSTPSFQDRLNKIQFKNDVPEKFYCPISLEIMNDPITVACGRAYDRESLVAYFASKNNPAQLSDPETRGIIKYSELSNITNNYIKNDIEDFVAAKEAEHKNRQKKKIKKKKPKPGPKLFDYASAPRKLRHDKSHSPDVAHSVNQEEACPNIDCINIPALSGPR